MRFKPTKPTAMKAITSLLLPIWCTLLFCQFSFTTIAQTQLPPILSDNMLIQHSAEVKLWGWDTPGQPVRLTPSWSRKGVEVRTNEAGRWEATLSSPAPGGPHRIRIQGSSTITLQNVLAGELWLCSGQSNMDRQLGLQRGQKPIVNYWETAQQADLPEIRLFVVKRSVSEVPQQRCEGEWVVCSPEEVLKFSAVGYFFGKKLHETLSMPVGLIESAWGGTPVEAWTSKEALNNAFLLERERRLLAQYEADSIAYTAQREAWEKGYLQNPPPLPESWGVKRRLHHRIGGLYNGMIHPLLPLRIRGVIWYQGESNRNFPRQYEKQFPNLIRTWRQAWGIGDFPFYFVQIAPYYYNGAFNIPPIWEAQYAALQLPHTGMAATQDIGQIYDIHPPEKEEVGRRLALIALNQTYNRQDVVYSGPVLKQVTYEAGKALLEFDPRGGELFSAGNGIGGIPSFFVADERRI
ncbi:MAG: sialate O-acetylesterase, partial [Bacteroidetes bacterium]